MKTTTWKTRASFYALIAALFCCPPPAARAQNFTFNGPGNSSVVTFTSGLQVYAGQYKATLNGSSINIFCTDFTHEIFDNDQYIPYTTYDVTATAAAPSSSTGTVPALTNGYYHGGLASALNSKDYNPANLTTSGYLNATQRADEVAYLADTYLNVSSFTNAAGTTDLDSNFAGVSLAIWDIVQNGGKDTFTFGSAGALSGGATGTYGAIASYYESQAAGKDPNGSSTADWIQAPRDANYGHKQDYVTELPGALSLQSPVPEPKFSVLLLSFGVIGSACWLRRRVSAQ